MIVKCVVRNIPNSAPKREAAKKLCLKGHSVRKRGRGARALPLAFRDYRGNVGYAGGEYQDLPLEKASRFNAYIAPTKWTPDQPCTWQYFDYAGVTEDGRLRVRVTPQ